MSRNALIHALILNFSRPILRNICCQLKASHVLQFSSEYHMLRNWFFFNEIHQYSLMQIGEASANGFSWKLISRYIHFYLFMPATIQFQNKHVIMPTKFTIILILHVWVASFWHFFFFRWPSRRACFKPANKSKAVYSFLGGFLMATNHGLAWACACVYGSIRKH